MPTPKRLLPFLARVLRRAFGRLRKGKTNGADADLATAMAVSGAAASSYMGLGSIPSLTALLTFLNVRLGFWILRPDRKRWLRSAKHVPGPPHPGAACTDRFR